MLSIVKTSGKLNEILFMGMMMFCCLLFSLFRVFYTDSFVFLFLNWNLFLAFIPWALTSLVVVYPRLRKRKVIIPFILCCWLLFFPNAPYILTDLFHLRLRTSMPIWFDLVLILSYAWTGLFLGFLSLWDIEKFLLVSIKQKWVSLISGLLLFIGSFGVYIGRFLRWNSWDIITEPFNLAYDIQDRLVNPFQHPTTWGMTLFMGVFLNMLYWSFKLIGERKGQIKN